MLTSVQSLQTKRCGVVDEEEKKIIIPLEYKSISFQKNGIVAEEFEDNNGSKEHSVVFNLKGEPVLRAFSRVVLLDNNILITSSVEKGLCYLANSEELRYLFNFKLDGILFFCGNEDQAVLYNVKQDISKILNNPEFVKNGGYVENRIAIHSAEKNKWGIWDCSTNSMWQDFCFDVMVQLKNGKFVTRDSKGEPLLLS